jgi:hypothetical protein
LKQVFFTILTISLVSLTGCEVDYRSAISTGLIGHVRYGIGDCMPVIIESPRVYDNYNGDLYFIVKTDLDNLGNGDFDELKANSIETQVKNGELAIELPADTFLVMPYDVYLYSDANMVVIREGIILEKDFKFWKCISY